MGADAQTAPEPGLGTAFAQAFKVDPKAGGLSIGLAFGQSTATHANQVAKAVSTGTNMGVVGLTLAAQGCDGSAPTWAKESQPQPLVIDSRDEGAAAGKEESEKYNGTITTGTASGSFIFKKARANSTPFGQAETTITGGGQSGFAIGNSVTRSWSGLVNGVREARATVEIEYIELAGSPGSVRLNGLRWDALHRSTGDKKVDGHFYIGSVIRDGGTPIGPLRDTDATNALKAVDNQLKLVGLRVVPGTIRTSKDMVTVDPLAIVVEPNQTRDDPARRVFTNPDYQRNREELFKRILEQYCKAGTYISVADIVIGSATGAGEFVLSLGGAEATTGEAPKNEFNLDLGTFGTTGGIDIPPELSVETSFISSDTVSGPIAAIAPTIQAVLAPAKPVPRTRLVTPAAHTDPPPPFKGTRGGALAAVGLVTLGVLAVVAEGDRRMMRAQRRAMGADG